MMANLQKGLRLVYKGEELIGEGAGFGVPVLCYCDDTFFSGSSNLSLTNQGNFIVLRKEFLMDKVQRKEIRRKRLENQKLRAIWRFLDKLYQKHRHLQSIIVTDIAKRMGINFTFVDANPVGKVVVTYCISRERINVRTDFTLLRKDRLRKIFLLNEQGTRFFRRYSDSDGSSMIDKHIGAWRNVEAKSANITDAQEKVGFELSKKKGSVLYVGREVVDGSADWIGLDYELECVRNTFEYKIRIMEHED
jgi:hypothetical protein